MGSIRLADQNIAALIELRTQRTWQPGGLRECSKHPFPPIRLSTLLPLHTQTLRNPTCAARATP